MARLSPEVVNGASAAICRQLGFTNAENKVTVSSLEEYSRVFDQPLGLEHLRALAALFGWNAPPKDEVRTAGEVTIF